MILTDKDTAGVDLLLLLILSLKVLFNMSDTNSPQEAAVGKQTPVSL